MRTRGFTLIELIIALAIIGILAAVIFPALAKLVGVRAVDSDPAPTNAVTVQQVNGSLSCKDGFLVKDGQPVTNSGVAVKC